MSCQVVLISVDNEKRTTFKPQTPCRWIEEFRPGTIAAAAIKPSKERQRGKRASERGLLPALWLNGGGVFGFLCLVVAHWCVRTALEERKGEREGGREGEREPGIHTVSSSKSLLGRDPILASFASISYILKRKKYS